MEALTIVGCLSPVLILAIARIWWERHYATVRG